MKMPRPPTGSQKCEQNENDNDPDDSGADYLESIHCCGFVAKFLRKISRVLYIWKNTKPANVKNVRHMKANPGRTATKCKKATEDKLR
jgi:hypothetical protein